MLELELPCGCYKQFSPADLSPSGHTTINVLCAHEDKYKVTIIAQRTYTITAIKEEEET